MMAFFMECFSLTRALIPSLPTAKFIHQFLDDANLIHRPLVVALSGGLDSMVMLRLMLELRSKYQVAFSAFHVNHGLNENAQEWQRFVKQFCQINSIDLITTELTIKKVARHSLEQLARDNRYLAMSQQLENQSVIITGHHQFDQLETFMLRLQRGSGLKGLGAMHAVAPMPNSSGLDKDIVLARPLLSFDQAALQAYANQHHLDWVEDDSNDDIHFDRNFIRHEVAPTLSARWPHFSSAVMRTTQHLQSDSALLAEYLREELSTLIEKVSFGDVHGEALFSFSALNIEALAQKSKLKQVALLREYVEQVTGRVSSSKATSEIIEAVINSKPDKQPLLVVNDYSIKRHQDHLFILNESMLCKPVFELETNVSVINYSTKPQSYPNNGTKRTLQVKVNSADTLSGAWEMHYGIAPSKITPNSKSGSKKLSELFKQKKCPAWLRPMIPLLVLDGQTMIVVGFATDINFDGEIRLTLKDGSR